MEKIRVLVTDDHAIVRDGISALLALTGDIEVVGEATNGREALEVVSKLAPDIVIMDMAMPLMDGLELNTRTKNMSYPLLKLEPVVLSVRQRRPQSLLRLFGLCTVAILFCLHR